MSIFIVTIASIITFFLCSLLLLVEERRGDRILLAGSRTALDKLMVRALGHIRYAIQYIFKRVITLSWYYSLHAILKMLLKFIAGLYFAVEQIFISNRNKARQLRRSQNDSHLTALSAHQKETELTESEKKKRKEKALKG